MKRILVLRHGKSDWDAEYGGDHERPLNGRGLEAARQMGRLITSTGQEPDLVLSSTAVRALTTAQSAAASGGWSCPLEEAAGLYEAGAEGALELLRGLSDDVERVLVVGHEPTSSELIGRLVGGAAVHFPTAALARIDAAVERWRDLGPGSGTLAWVITPKLARRICGEPA